ncbi:MAG: phosphoribosylformylglycinamidine synthase I [Candidatus Bathyarchaeota archaeon]
MRIAVIQFPGSNCDLDTIHVLRDIFKVSTDLVWHRFFKGSKYDTAILPGGFSYGDHLRAGVIAAHSPAMKEIRDMAKDGKPILGICNGFQVLIEAGLLPGALLPNECLTFVCKWVTLKCDTNRTAFTQLADTEKLLRIPIAHQEGRYYDSEKNLREMFANKQVVFRYSDEKGAVSKDANPNGSVENIAGICNLEGNVLGLMPHPERASEKILSPFKSDGGLNFFASMIQFLKKRGAA